MDNEPPIPLAGRRLLLVEDDPIVALTLEESLREQGLVIAGLARDLRSALALAADSGVEIALLDVKLGADGVGPVADLLAARGCPFVFTSGCGESELPRAHAAAGFVEKPFTIEDVVEALRRELARRN